jgi:wobble nucleotide-excising tRNase
MPGYMPKPSNIKIIINHLNVIGEYNKLIKKHEEDISNLKKQKQESIHKISTLLGHEDLF